MFQKNRSYLDTVLSFEILLHIIIPSHYFFKVLLEKLCVLVAKYDGVAENSG